MDDSKTENHRGKILLACTGSVASIKVPIIVDALLKLKATDLHIIKQMREQMTVVANGGKQFQVKVITTDKALHFFDRDAISTVQLLEDHQEWESWSKIGDPVLHIELRKWADLMIIAPLDANTMAKLVNGICDNLLTCIVRAWDVTKPLLFAPAMNTYMWDHPITRVQIEKLKEFGYKELPPVVKKLACGDFGTGAMAEVSTIVSVIVEEHAQTKTAENT